MYKIVFNGKIAAGKELSDVKLALAELYKLDASKTEVFFDGNTYTLKDKLNGTDAERYLIGLKSIGLLVDKVWEGSVAPLPTLNAGLNRRVTPNSPIPANESQAYNPTNESYAQNSAYESSDYDEEEHDEDFSELNYFSWNGRIGRVRLITRNITLSLLVSLILVFLQYCGLAKYAGILSIPTFYLYLVFSAQRLHDLNKSAVWLVLSFVPLANVLLVIYLLFFSGIDSENDYGPPPPPNSRGLYIMLFSILFLNFIAFWYHFTHS